MSIHSFYVRQIWIADSHYHNKVSYFSRPLEFVESDSSGGTDEEIWQRISGRRFHLVNDWEKNPDIHYLLTYTADSKLEFAIFGTSLNSGWSQW